MAKNELLLEVSRGNNPKIMRLFDTSFYCNSDVLENYLIEVLPVNTTTWLTFHVRENFSLALNSSSLQYKKTASPTELIDLPDGIYEFKQSVKPNIQTIVHFIHLRTVALLNRVLSERDKLFKNRCQACLAEFNKSLDELRSIFEYIDAAEWAVSECHDKKRGKEMYEWAKTLLKKYTNDCQC